MKMPQKYITKVLNSFHKNVKRKTLFFFSTAVSMVLSACGRETRSTDETPLKDETTNTPTAFNDRLVTVELVGWQMEAGSFNRILMS